MSRQPDSDDDPEDQDNPEPPGHIGATSAAALVGFGLGGLVLGWLLRPVSIRFTDVAPTVGWLPVAALFLVALIVGSVALGTHRVLHKHLDYIEPHRAVNRLLLAKSCALAGALIGGGYLGYAMSYLGLVESELAWERVTQSLLAALASVLIVIGSLFLERACRVSGEDD